jgi:hypothetical protein
MPTQTDYKSPDKVSTKLITTNVQQQQSMTQVSLNFLKIFKNCFY